jgi:hypothetical protein
MDWDEMSRLYRGPPIDASYQVSVHLAKRFQRRRFFRNHPIRTKFMVVIFVNGSGRNDQSQQRTFHRCFLPSCGSFGQTVSEEKNLIFSIVFYFLLIFFTNFQVLEVATAMFDGSRGHHSWSERELYMHCSFIVW